MGLPWVLTAYDTIKYDTFSEQMIWPSHRNDIWFPIGMIIWPSLAMVSTIRSKIETIARWQTKALRQQGFCHLFGKKMIETGHNSPLRAVGELCPFGLFGMIISIWFMISLLNNKHLTMLFLSEDMTVLSIWPRIFHACGVFRLFDVQRMTIWNDTV